MERLRKLASAEDFKWLPSEQSHHKVGSLSPLRRKRVLKQATGGSKKLRKASNKKVLVAENDELKLFVKLVSLKRMTRFNIQDLLYHFEVEKLVPDENITILGFSHILEKGLAKTIQLIQDLYKAEKENYL